LEQPPIAEEPEAALAIMIMTLRVGAAQPDPMAMGKAAAMLRVI
jgi:hypothetical protein